MVNSKFTQGYRSFQLWRNQCMALWVLARVFIQSLMERGIFFSVISKNIALNEKLKRVKFIFLVIFYQNLIFIFNKIFKCTNLMGNYKGNKFYSLQFFIQSFIFEGIEKIVPRFIRLCIKTPANLTRGVVGRYIFGTIYWMGDDFEARSMHGKDPNTPSSLPRKEIWL